MTPELETAVRLQAIDQQISHLQKEIAALPKHIAEIEKKLVAHERRLEIDRTALIANQKDRKRLEGDIQSQEAKISKLRGQMTDARTNEQYRAFQHEIEFCEREIRSTEDRILQLMEEAEPLEKNVKAAEASLKEERKQVEAEKAEAEKTTAADRSKADDFDRQRKEALASLSPQMASAYERIRKARGVAVSEAVDGRCSQCHMALRPQFLQDLKRAEKPMFCESCGRILFWNPPRSAEDIAGINALSEQGSAHS